MADENEDVGTRYYGTTIDDPLNYGFGYGNENLTMRDASLQPGDRFYSGEAPIDSGEIPRMPDFAGGESQDHDFTKEEAEQLWKAGVWDQVKGLGKQALDLFKDKNGAYDLKKLLAMGGGLLAASKSNAGAAPTGYQGKIPKLTATSNMLTAPPVGRRPGSGGINYGGGTTYRNEKGEVVSSNEKTLAELRAAAESNPFNRPSTYENPSYGRPPVTPPSGGGLPDIAPPKTPATPAPTTPITPTAPVAGGGTTNPSTGGGVAAIGARPTTPMASGNTTALREQLRAEYASGPKTQEQLDKLLLKYPPAVMQAEFPEFGGVANYNNATMEAYQRSEQQARQRSREAMRGSNQGVVVANPGSDTQISIPQAPKMSAIPQSELAAARAKLTPEQAAFIDWRMAQVNPMTGQRVYDDYVRQGSNPYADNAGTQAQAQLNTASGRKELLSQNGVDTAGIAPWEDQNWRDQQKKQEDAERARMDKQTADWLQIPESQRPVAGPGASTEAPSGYGNYLDKQMYTAPTATGGIADLVPAPQAATPAAPTTPAPAAPEPTSVAPEPPPPENYVFDSYQDHMAGSAKGGLLRDGFVVPADVVSHFGNGSSEAGLKLLAERIGATPIKGEGDGMSDSIKTKIDGVQEARVANDEAYVSPEKVKELGNGSPEKGARKLYAMMDQVRKARTGTTKQGKEIDPNKFMPGGSVQRYDVGGTTTRTVPTGATGSESSLSNWAGDYVTNMLGQGAAQANKPYEAYTGPLTAGASGLQNQAFTQAGNMQTPASIGQAATTAGGIASLAPGAGQYTSVGTDFGTTQAQQYMNPYLQSALNPAMEEARRQADISRIDDAGRLTRAGAYGGSRQAIMESEGRRNLMDKQNQMLTSGYSTAFDKAQQQFNADQARRINEQQFATTSGLQGLQTGLQGAQTQGQLGSLQSQTDLAGINALANLGGMQRGIESEGIAADKAQFEEARLNPYKMVQFQQSLLSGLPLSAQSYSMPGQSNLQQFSEGASTVDKLLRILSGQQQAATK